MNNMNDPNRLPIAIVIAAAILGAAFILKGNGTDRSKAPSDAIDGPGPAMHMPMIDGGHVLPLEMEDMMAARLVSSSVIDPARLPQATELNLLWAFGLANKNPILEKGPMTDPRYGGPQNLASVGGWTVAKGDALDHYSMHEFMRLTPEQQALVEKVSQNVFRPCCKNSAYFPDCNHGMAMLGLLEILASQGMDEPGLLAAAENANALWFPQERQAGCGIDPGRQARPAVPARKGNDCGL